MTMTKVTIDGRETERADGTVRCIGYGVDSEGRVTARFALPEGYEWDAPEGTQSVEYVDSMAELPERDDYYRDSS